MTKKCAVVLLNWKNLEDTIECIESLSISDYPGLEIIVSDNGFDPSFPRILHKLFPQIQILENKKNLGFAEGNNVAIRTAFQNQAEYVFILNTDTAIRKDTITQLIKVFESNPKIGIVGATTWEYTDPVEAQSSGGYYNPSETIYKWYSEITNKSRSSLKYVEVDFVFGSAMCIRRKMAEQIGLFNSDYFCYFEDIEWCYRSTKTGWKVVVALDSHIWHKMGSKEPGELIRPVTGYYYLRNHNYFISQYGNAIAQIRRNYTNLKTMMKVQLLLMLYRLGIPVSNIDYHYALKQGILDFYRGLKGEQNTWMMNNRKTVEKQKITIDSKRNQFQVLIPLPDLNEKELSIVKDFIINLAQEFPEIEFLIWIYPTNVMINELFSSTVQNHIQLKDGWLVAEEWKSDSFIRWTKQNVQMDIYGQSIEIIHMEVRPKLSRIYSGIQKLIPKVSIPGLKMQVWVNGKQVTEINLNEIKFIPIKFSFPASNHVHIELKSNKAYNYGLFDYRKISVAVKNIQYSSPNSKNISYDINTTMGASGLLSNTYQYFAKELKHINNIRQPNAKEIRNTDKLFSNSDLIILSSSEQTGTRLGKIITSNRFKIPIVATPKTIGKLPVRAGEDLVISPMDKISIVLRKLLNSKENRDKLTQNMQRTLAQYFE